MVWPIRDIANTPYPLVRDSKQKMSFYKPGLISITGHHISHDILIRIPKLLKSTLFKRGSRGAARAAKSLRWSV